MVYDNHTQIYYEYLERTYRLKTFYEYTKPIISGFSDEAKNVEKKDSPQNKKILNGLNQGLVILSEGTDNLFDHLKVFDLKRADEFIPYFMSLLYIFLNMLMEQYINDIFKKIYKNEHRMLKNSNVKYSTEEILNYENIETLINRIIEDEIYRFNKRGYKKKITYLKKLLNSDLWRISNMQRTIVQISEIRNLLVHNDGIVNQEYIDRVKETQYRIGEKINITEDKLIHAIDITVGFIALLDEEIHEKFFPDEILFQE